MHVSSGKNENNAKYFIDNVRLSVVKYAFLAVSSALGAARGDKARAVIQVDMEPTVPVGVVADIRASFVLADVKVEFLVRTVHLTSVDATALGQVRGKYIPRRFHIV